MKKLGSRKNQARFLSPDQRMSSAQTPFSAGGAVPVRLVPNRPFDIAQATKYACRSTNLNLLKKHLFDDSLAKISLAAEVANARMAFFLAADDTVEPEMAEHIEKSIGLSAGWLDERRESLSDNDVAALREQVANFKRDEEVELPTARVHLIRDNHQSPGTLSPLHASATAAAGETDLTNSPPAPQHGTARGTQVPLPTSRSRSQPTIVEYQNSVAKEIKVIKLAPELEWLNNELARAPRGSRSKVAKIMGRNPNDLSAWLNGLRAMPQTARAPLLRALHAFDKSLGEEATRRFNASSDPIISGESQTNAQQMAETQSPTKATVAQRVAGTQPATVTTSGSPKKAVRRSDPSVDTASTKVHSTLAAPRTITEMDEIAMRTAQTLAEIISSVMRRMERSSSEGAPAKDVPNSED